MAGLNSLAYRRYLKHISGNATTDDVEDYLCRNELTLRSESELFKEKRSLSATDMTSLIDNKPEVIFPNVSLLVKQFNNLVDSECFASESTCDDNHVFLNQIDVTDCSMAENLDGSSTNANNFGRNILQQADNSASQLKLKLLDLQCPRKVVNLGSTYKWEPTNKNIVEHDNYLTKERLKRLDSRSGGGGDDDVFVDRNRLYRYLSKDSLITRHSTSSQEFVSPCPSSKSNSMDNLRNINGSISCDNMLGTVSPWGTSTSSDSAVIVEGEISRSSSVSPSFGTSPGSRRSRPNFINFEGSSDLSTEINEQQLRKSILSSRTSANSVQLTSPRPPSVVISDHSGGSISVHVALASDGFSLNNVLNSYSDYYLNDGYVCPRKVSECSTCSSVSTIDMNSTAQHRTSFDYNPEDWKNAGVIGGGGGSSSSRRNSDCSSCYLTGSEDEVEVVLEQPTPPPIRKSGASSNWRKVRNVVQWTPFIQTYKRHKYPWVQLAGHQGNFRAGHKQGTIIKKLCPSEEKAFDSLMKDVLKPFVPEYTGVVDGSDNEKYLQLQDLLSDFSTACVMDIKMGVRTYLEDELAKARIKPKLRKDMYDKMVQIDMKAPTEAEHKAKAVTKPRYMVWRETISSTATLGFRIEGIRKGDGNSSKDYKTTKTRDQVSKVILNFVNGYPSVMEQYIERLKEIREILRISPFFKSHELIGSSLLFVHNNEKCGVWLIDFAKTIPLPSEVTIAHDVPWIEGTHEDGYLIGFDNLVDLMEKSMASLEETTSSSSTNHPRESDEALEKADSLNSPPKIIKRK